MLIPPVSTQTGCKDTSIRAAWVWVSCQLHVLDYRSPELSDDACVYTPREVCGCGCVCVCVCAHFSLWVEVVAGGGGAGGVVAVQDDAGRSEQEVVQQLLDEGGAWRWNMENI